MSLPVVIIISAVIIIISVILIVLTVMDFVSGLKNHDYSMHKYYQEELDERGLEYNENGELVPKGTAANAEIDGGSVGDDSSDEEDDTPSDEDED